MAEPRVEGQQYVGSVKYYNIEKGYGFITFDDKGEDCFVHQSAIVSDGFRCLTKGDRVRATYTLRNGKETATEVTSEDGNPVHKFGTRLEAFKARDIANRDPDIKVGKCKWFDNQRGFGFLVVEGTDEDIFCHKKFIIDQAVQPKEEMAAEFKIEPVEGKDGKFHATNVTFMDANGMPVRSSAPAAPPAFSPYGNTYPPQSHDYGYQQRPAPQHHQHYAPPPVQRPGVPGVMSGTVKWFNTAKGFGFIVPASGGKDVYVSAANISANSKPLETGDLVEYEEENSPDGKSWAINANARSSGSLKRKAEPVPSPYPKHPRSTYEQPRGVYEQPRREPAPQYDPYAAYPPAPAAPRADVYGQIPQQAPPAQRPRDPYAPQEAYPPVDPYRSPAPPVHYPPISDPYRSAPANPAPSPYAPY